MDEVKRWRKFKWGGDMLEEWSGTARGECASLEVGMWGIAGGWPGVQRTRRRFWEKDRERSRGLQVVRE